MIEALTSNPKTLKPGASINVSELADSSVNLAVRTCCRLEDYCDVYFATMKGCKLASDKAGIKIPYAHAVEIQKPG